MATTLYPPFNHNNDGYSTFSGTPGIAGGSPIVSVATGEGSRFPSSRFPVRIWNVSDYAHPVLDPQAELLMCLSRVGDALSFASNTLYAHNTAGKTYAVMDAVIASEWLQVSQYPVVYMTPSADLVIPANYALVSRGRYLPDSGIRIKLESGASMFLL